MRKVYNMLRNDLYEHDDTWRRKFLLYEVRNMNLIALYVLDVVQTFLLFFESLDYMEIAISIYVYCVRRGMVMSF